MKPTIPLFAVLMLLAGACRQNTGREAAEPAPKTAEEYTLAIIKEVQKVILSTDQQLREYQPQRLELPAGEGQEASVLQLWTEEGNPVRLTATVAGERGQARELSAFYFANSELFFATQPGARFIFIGTELKYWLDEDWKPQPAPEQARKEREQELLEQAERYLRLFEMQ
ncbi:MAG: hypothetical protein H6557_05330 [Lewinellaceae bacterium]|nr:hypothetical protein [Phaeodactylibacter sp.]MCB9036026.1 hypothetical protein [Lewinellaceae bacterium]